MRRIALLALIAGCAASKPPEPKCLDCGPPGMPDPELRHAAEQRKQICARVRVLRGEQCAFDRMDPAILEDCSVVDSVFIAGVQDCLGLDVCDDLMKCIRKVKLEGAPYRGPTTACTLRPGQAPTIPAGVSEIELAASYGRTDKKFSDSTSSKAKPIEVCGMPAQLEYLTRVTCDDGSKPFADRIAADRSRVGNVGEAGRCGRIVDQYAVACPEKTYDVFVDPYRCPGRH